MVGLTSELRSDGKLLLIRFERSSLLSVHTVSPLFFSDFCLSNTFSVIIKSLHGFNFRASLELHCTAKSIILNQYLKAVYRRVHCAMINVGSTYMHFMICYIYKHKKRILDQPNSVYKTKCRNNERELCWKPIFKLQM